MNIEQKAKECLDKHIDKYYKKNKMARFDDIPQTVFYNAMEEYANQDKWISVEDDRMPDHNGAVLCCNINEDVPIYIGIQTMDGEREFYLFELEENSKRVTHWMELPNKPK